MSENTKNLDLFKYDVEQDKKSTFNIDLALNNNWDKIDAYAENQENLTNNKVSKSGDTMTGALTVNMPNNSTLNVKSNSLSYNEFPISNDGFGQFAILDKNNAWIGLYGVEKYTDGRNQAKMQVKGVDGTQARVNLRVYADGSTGYDFPMCKTKATTTSSARGDLVAVVVQNYVNGTSWYRIWSDGWIEQGGYITPINTNPGITVTFLKSYNDTSYNLQATALFDGQFTCTAWIRSKTKDKCVISGQRWNNASVTDAITGAHWYACGY